MSFYCNSCQKYFCFCNESINLHYGNENVIFIKLEAFEALDLMCTEELSNSPVFEALDLICTEELSNSPTAELSKTLETNKAL